MAPDPPIPAEIPGEPLSAPVGDADSVAEARGMLPDAEALAEPEDTAADDDVEELQARLYRGVVDRVLPTMPKLGEGVVGAASWSVYHQTLVVPNRGHPTASQ